MKPLIRIYHPWDKWEDYRFNFYGPKKAKSKSVLDDYAMLLRDIPLFAATLDRIIKEWRFSCEHNLTNESMNRIAYLGQAACAFLFEIPSHESMGGYNLLTEYEKHAADSVALYYLNMWLVREGYDYVSYQKEVKNQCTTRGTEED